MHQEIDKELEKRSRKIFEKLAQSYPKNPKVFFK